MTFGFFLTSYFPPPKGTTCLSVGAASSSTHLCSETRLLSAERPSSASDSSRAPPPPRLSTSSLVFLSAFCPSVSTPTTSSQSPLHPSSPDDPTIQVVIFLSCCTKGKLLPCL